jgi:hypothetical protein
MKGMGYQATTAGAMAACLVLGLSGCPTVDLGDTPPDIGACNPMKGIDYFTTDIEPKFYKVQDTANGCARSSGCHDQAHGLTLDRNPGSDAVNYKVTQAYLNCGQPAASLLLTKPMAGVEGHGGGDLFQMSDMQTQVFLDWFK